MTLTYTVAQVIELAMSKIGIRYAETEPKNIEDAFRNLNAMLGMWSADADLAINRVVPVTGYTSLTDTVDVPPEYIPAIFLNLAVMISPDYDQPVDKALAMLADSTLSSLRIFNVRRIAGCIPTNKR